MTDDLTQPPPGGAGDDADDLDLVFIRHFSGRLSWEDRRRLERWLAQTPGRAQELERLRELWVRTAAEPMNVDAPRGLARFKERASREEASEAARISAVRRRVLLTRLAPAAAVVLAVGVGFWAYPFIQMTPPRAPAVAAISHAFSTPRGQRAQLHLPDGTRVLLAPNSSLDVPRSFGTTTRDVHLTGLAFFEVAKDSTHPFRVHTEGGTAQVLGTKFSARADSGGRVPLEVVVAEGRVAMRSVIPGGDASVPPARVLSRGDLGRLSPDGTLQVSHGVDLTRRLGWIDGRLDFDRTPLPVVVRELESWFDVEFIIADPALRDAHLTTTLRNDSLREMLRLLETALGAKAEVTGQTVTLTRAHQAQ